MDELEQMAEKLARQFHETYERLAPSFGYETRKESAKPWSEVPERNRRLMVAVCAEIVQAGYRAAEARIAALEEALEQIEHHATGHPGGNMTVEHIEHLARTALDPKESADG